MNDYRDEKLIQSLKLHKIWIETIGREGKKLAVDEVDFRDIDLADYPLDQAYLTACVFNGMNLSGKDMYASVVCSSTFEDANLESADFYKADVSYANFSNANLQNARFARSDCIETIFNKADLRNAKLVGALFDQVDFRNANLQNTDVSTSTFEEVLLQAAQLEGMRGLEEAFIKSINIGTPEQPIILKGEDARQWLIINSKSTDNFR